MYYIEWKEHTLRDIEKFENSVKIRIVKKVGHRKNIYN